MRARKTNPLSTECEAAILKRARFILCRMGVEASTEINWIDATLLITSMEGGLYFTWLAITGCYPTKFELENFHSTLSIHDFERAALDLLHQRFKSILAQRLLLCVVLIDPKNTHLVDVTHTSSAPYLTGIQRVVYGVTEGVPNVTTFAWIGSSGVLSERILSRYKPDAGNAHSKRGWRESLVFFLHSLVPVLDKSPISKRVRRSSLPLARKIKKWLISSEIRKLLASGRGPEIQNILLLNVKITIPEIPSPQHIFLYEAILENSVIPIQVILYDFIPLFHAWTVHPNNRGNLNIYLRLILLADRVISISNLVQNQAKLISKAFKLERTEWQNRSQFFDYLPLPSGLKSATLEEFHKDPLLVVMAGSLEPRKNHMQFLDALEILNNRDIPIKGVILGTAGWENEEILDRIHQLQNEGVSIRRAGNLSDSEIREQIGKAQVLLQISEAEGFGLPISEALALGTRVIVSNISPLKEWEGDRVQIVELHDSVKLAELLSEILQNRENSTKYIQQINSWKAWTDLLYSNS